MTLDPAKRLFGWGLGQRANEVFRVQGIQDIGFTDQGFGLRDQGSGLRDLSLEGLASPKITRNPQQGPSKDNSPFNQKELAPIDDRSWHPSFKALRQGNKQTLMGTASGSLKMHVTRAEIRKVFEILHDPRYLMH